MWHKFGRVTPQNIRERKPAKSAVELRATEASQTFSLQNRGTSLIRNSAPVGPYRRTMPRLLWRSWGGAAVSYERGTLQVGVLKAFVPMGDAFNHLSSEHPVFGYNSLSLYYSRA